MFSSLILSVLSSTHQQNLQQSDCQSQFGLFADRSSFEAKLGQLLLVFLMLGYLVQRCLSQAMVLHLEVDGQGGVPVVHEPLLAQGVAGSRWNIGMALVVHHSNLCVLFRLQWREYNGSSDSEMKYFEEDSIKLGKDQAAKLNYPRER